MARPLPLAIALLLAAGAASAAVAVTNAGGSSIAIAHARVPAELAPSLHGSTTVGLNQSSAVTTVTSGGVLLAGLSLLEIQNNGLDSQNVLIRYESATGLNRIVTARVQIAGVDHVVISNGVVTMSSGTPVTLAPGTLLTAGGTIQIDRGQKASVRIQIELTSTIVPSVTAKEPWRIELD